MARPRQHKSNRGHFALLVNKAARAYNPKAVNELVSEIKAKGGSYTVYEPESGMDLLKQAEVAVGVRHATREYAAPFSRAGKVTALVACGGDGTFNLAARAALKAGLPIGCLPLGKVNNIARSLHGATSVSKAIQIIVNGEYQLIDTALAAEIPFFGSAAVGFFPHMVLLLKDRGLPRLSLGWSQLGAKAAADVPQIKTTLKVDAFRFEVSPILLNVNVLPYTAGLPVSPASLPADGLLEVIFDHGATASEFSSYTRRIYKRKYLYGDEIRLYRGKAITIQPLRGRRMYLDGEVIEVPHEILEIKLGESQLGVFS
jgi:diacylglycerol kinase (ATP)